MLLQELLPFMPEVAREVVPALIERLASRVAARALRDVFVADTILPVL
jgi:aarF domain-containing kinase